MAGSDDNVVAADGSSVTSARSDSPVTPGDPDSTRGVDSDSAVPLEDEPIAAVRMFGDRIDLARAYVASLATDGVVRGLIGPREPARLWTRHVVNSAVIAELIEQGVRVVDIGSGAGLPGIPLAIARPDLRITLVEPLERRVRYLSEMIEALDLRLCRVVRGRAEDVISECGDADVVTSRAVAPLHRLAGWSAPLTRVGGIVLAMKGQSAAEELNRDRSAVAAAGLIDAEVLEIRGYEQIDTTYVVRATRSAKTVAGSRANRPGRRRR